MLEGHEWNARNRQFWDAHQPMIEQQMRDPFVAMYVNKNLAKATEILKDVPSQAIRNAILRTTRTFEQTVDHFYDRIETVRAPLREIIALQATQLAEQQATIADHRATITAFERRWNSYSESQRSKAQRPRGLFEDFNGHQWSSKTFVEWVARNHPDTPAAELWEHLISAMKELMLDPEVKNDRVLFRCCKTGQERKLSRRTFKNLVSKVRRQARPGT